MPEAVWRNEISKTHWGIIKPKLKRLLHRIKKSVQVPRLSETEREALDAGTVWLDRALFTGSLRWPELLKMEYPHLSPEEKSFLDGPVEDLCGSLDREALEANGNLPVTIWEDLRSQGFFGLSIPKSYGGREFSALGKSAVFGRLATCSLSLSVVVLIPNSVGPGELLLKYGTTKQKDYFLPRLARGEEIPCFGLTEPEAGSDAASLSATGIVKQDQEGLYLELNFSKRTITLAPVATLIALAFRLLDPQGLLGGPVDLGITVALVDSSLEGIRIGKRHDPMGLGFPNGPIRGEGVRVDLDAIIGGPRGHGRGWTMLMEALSGGRALSLPSQSVAGARWLARVAGAWCEVRHQFGRPLHHFAGVEEALTRIAGHTYALESARLLTCAALDQGEQPSVLSALMKQRTTAIARDLAKDGMDLLGGAAICRGPHNLVAEGWIAAPIGITVEGANILTRTLITFGQGILRCHPALRAELTALEEERPKALLVAMGRHIRHLGRIILQWKLLLFTGARSADGPKGPLKRLGQRLCLSSLTFALLTESALMGFGPKLKTRGKIGGRFADALGALYWGVASIWRWHQEGKHQEDIPLVRWSVETALEETHDAFEGIVRHLPWGLRWPGKAVSKLSRWITSAQPPSDALGHQVAKTITRSGGARERLSRQTWNHHPGLLRLEKAFELQLKVAPIRRRLRQAQSPDPRTAWRAALITEDEKELLETAEKARLAALEIDERQFE